MPGVFTRNDGTAINTRSPTAGGFLDFMEQVGRENLPVPDLSRAGVDSWLAGLKADVSGATEETVRAVAARQHMLLIGLLVDLAATNLDTIWAWVLKSPKLMLSLIRACATDDVQQIGSLTAGEFLRLASACWEEVKKDKLLEGFGGFFGGLLPRRSHPPGSGGEPTNP